jgi:hypothetical protein
MNYLTISGGGKNSGFIPGNGHLYTIVGRSVGLIIGD